MPVDVFPRTVGGGGIFSRAWPQLPDFTVLIAGYIRISRAKHGLGSGKCFCAPYDSAEFLLRLVPVVRFPSFSTTSSPETGLIKKITGLHVIVHFFPAICRTSSKVNVSRRTLSVLYFPFYISTACSYELKHFYTAYRIEWVTFVQFCILKWHFRWR